MSVGAHSSFLRKQESRQVELFGGSFVVSPSNYLSGIDNAEAGGSFDRSDFIETLDYGRSSG